MRPWPSFADIKKRVCSILTSPISDLIYFTTGRSASLCGLILALNIFVVPVTGTAATFAVYSPLITCIIMFSSEFIKARYVARQKAQLTEDKQIIDAAIVELALQKKLQEGLGVNHTYRTVLQILKEHSQGIGAPEVNPEKLLEAFSHYPHKETKETVIENLVKYVTSGINMGFYGLTSASGMFINFIMPDVLEDKSVDKLRVAACTLAIAYGIYGILTSLARSDQIWGELEKARQDVITAMNDFCEIYRQTHPEHLDTERMREFLSLWRPAPVAPAAQPDAVPQNNLPAV